MSHSARIKPFRTEDEYATWKGYSWTSKYCVRFDFKLARRVLCGSDPACAEHLGFLVFVPLEREGCSGCEPPIEEPGWRYAPPVGFDRPQRDKFSAEPGERSVTFQLSRRKALAADASGEVAPVLLRNGVTVNITCPRHPASPTVLVAPAWPPETRHKAVGGLVLRGASRLF